MNRSDWIHVLLEENSDVANRSCYFVVGSHFASRSKRRKERIWGEGEYEDPWRRATIGGAEEVMRVG